MRAVRGGANLLGVRDFNQRLVLETIRGNRGVSRAEIAQETGLTAQTISNIVRRLLDEELVVEDGKHPPVGGGKPKVRLRINSGAGFALGVQIDRDEVSAVLLDLGGRVIDSSSEVLQRGRTPDEVVDRIAGLVEGLVREAGGIGSKVQGLGVASPGPLDPAGGVLYGPPGFSGWDEVPIGRLLEERTGYPVIVDNDAVAASIGERWTGKARGVENFAFIYNGWGLGAGLFIEGHVLRGTRGLAGELGHMPLDPQGPECPCGNRGCLVSYCSPQEIVSVVENRLEAGESSVLAGESATSHPSLAAVRKAAVSGDRLATEVLVNCGKMLGKAVVSIVNLLDLQMIVLGGKALGESGFIYRQEVQKAVEENILYANRRRVEIVVSDAGDQVGAIGAASLVLHAAYAPRLMGLGSA